MERVTTVVHRFLREHLNPDSVILDLTAGQGNDTLFCAQHFKKVIAMDIQEEAIQATVRKCQTQTNVQLIHDDHSHLGNYIHEPLDAVLFNSGYLPKSLSKLTTQSSSTLKAFDASIAYLKKGGFLCATFYRKQDWGIEEYEACDVWFTQHTLQEVLYYRYPDDPLSPIVRIFQKF